MTDSQKENDTLGLMTIVTALGDFVSFFAILQILSNLGYSAAYSGYSVAIKSLGIAVAAVLIPMILSRKTTRQVLFGSQLLAAVVSSLLLSAYIFHFLSLKLGFGIVFLQAVLKQLFDAARAQHSKNITSGKGHLSVQSQLIASFYSAQFIGPVVAFFLVQYLPLAIPLVIDLVSFAFTAFVALRLASQPTSPFTHIFRPFRYVWANPKLRDILLLRSIGFWIGMGLFNYLLFSLVTDRFHLGIISSAWIYSAIGLGATLGAMLIRHPNTKTLTGLGKLNEGLIALIGHILLGAPAFFYFYLHSFWSALILIVIAGIGMGMNATVTQALRADLATQVEFSEILGAEILLARATDLLVCSIAVYSITQNNISLEHWMCIAGVVFLLNGILHLRFL